MKTQSAVSYSFLLVVLLAGGALAQTTSTQTTPDTSTSTAEGSQAPPMLPGGYDPSINLPIGQGSTGGRGLPGGKDPSIKIGASSKLSEAGDEAAKLGNWQIAASHYQDALDLWPDTPLALYGSAKCAEAAGNLDAAIGFYRAAVYSHNPAVYGTTPGDGWGTNNVEKMMDFVLTLIQAHQDAEAQKVYKRAAYVLNYQDSKFTGKPFLRVLLPEFGTSAGQVVYTPQRLRAIADTALAHEEKGFGRHEEAIAHMREAVRLYPNSPVTQYYLGEALLGPAHDSEAKAAYQKAAELGDERTIAAVKERL